MVGYQRNDTLTATQKLIAGCASGVMTRFITQPLDVIKIRTQLEKKALSAEERRRWFRTSRRILKEEGLAAFWQGHNLGQIHSVIAVSSQFYMYELTTRYVAGAPVADGYKPLMRFMCGILAGCFSASLVIPLEVIRVRQMLVKEQYKGILNGARMVFSSGGVLAFYEGLNASLLQMGPAVGISFAVFNVVQPSVLNYFHDCNHGNCMHSPGNPYRPEYLLLASTVAGSASGFVSKSLTYPFDLAKRRLQIRSHKEDSERFHTPSTAQNLAKCTKLIECLMHTYRAEGLKGLYRGWKVTIYKAQLTSVVAFTTYELVCYAVREMDS